VTGQFVPRNSDTKRGGTITYALWVWSTVRASKVTVQAASSAGTMRLPKFTLCPSAHGTRCKIATLPANQAFELKLTDQVRRTAKVGAPMTLTVSVQAASLSPAEATVTTVVTRHHHSPSGGSFPPLPPLPPTTTLSPFPGSTITPPSLGGLFPTVTPSASAQNARKQADSDQATRIQQASSALPLDPRLIGGQLAGLAVLAAAITMVVARLSLRTPQPATPQPAAPSPELEASADDKTADDKAE
jgi:hypothetical protein